MLSGLRGTVLGAMGCSLAGLLLIGGLLGGNAPAADPGPELAPPNPEASAPTLPPAGAAQAGAVDEQGGEAQTRGAIHEAFAEPYDRNPEPTKIVPRKPPEPINELAPDVKPDGDNVEWIPGYWGWDDERNDFVWVSGLWRKIPPGRRWVPGYWVEAQGGFRWVSGMWAEDRVEELNYLPDPPQSLEQGPNVAAPSDDYFWIPGSWVYANTGYRWRTGYWSVGYDNWMWVPARYVWSPRGCFYVPGYWDYAFARRGVLFSPVFFRPGIYARPAFAFSPSVVVSLGGISSHLFVGVGFGHYYFGDYYGDAYFRRGFQPWHVYHRRGYDPCLSYYSWYHRRHDHFDYARRLEDRHDHFVKNADLRPPRTYLAQRDWERRVGDARARETGELGRSLRDVQNRRDNDNGRGDNVKFVKVADSQRREIDQHRTQLRDISVERSKLERAAGDARVRGNVAKNGDGRATDGVGRPGADGRVPGDRGKGEPRGTGVADATRGDTPRLKLPKTVGAEQRASANKGRDDVPGNAASDGKPRGDGAGRVGDVGRTPGGNRGDGAGKVDGGRGTVGGQPRDGQPKTVEPREGQPRTVQPRDSQPRDSQPKTTQPRDSQPRSIQPRDSQPRDSQPRSIQPRDSQPRGGGGGSRDSQPRGGGRDRGRASTDDTPAVVTDKPATPAVIAKPREPVVTAPRRDAKPPTVVRARESSTETRLKPPVDVPKKVDTAPVRERAPKVTEPVKSPPAVSGGSSCGSGTESLGRSTGETRGRAESSETKGATKEKEEEKKAPSTGRGRGR